jgi:hypothetical protein
MLRWSPEWKAEQAKKLAKKTYVPPSRTIVTVEEAREACKPQGSRVFWRPDSHGDRAEILEN